MNSRNMIFHSLLCIEFKVTNITIEKSNAIMLIICKKKKLGECRESGEDASGNADQVPRNWGPMWTDGRRPEVCIGPQFRGTRSAFPDVSKPDSWQSHCYLGNWSQKLSPVCKSARLKLKVPQSFFVCNKKMFLSRLCGRVDLWYAIIKTCNWTSVWKQNLF